MKSTGFNKRLHQPATVKAPQKTVVVFYNATYMVKQNPFDLDAFVENAFKHRISNATTSLNLVKLYALKTTLFLYQQLPVLKECKYMRGTQ